MPLETDDGSPSRYHLLFDSIDQGFTVLKMIFEGDGESRRPVDYVFLEANPAFVAQTGLANAIGQRMRDLAPDHESHWFEIYGKVALTGEPTRFEAPAEALNRWYDVYAFRIDDPADASRRSAFRRHHRAKAHRGGTCGGARTPARRRAGITRAARAA